MKVSKMVTTGFIPFVTVVFGLGLSHALDTDYVVAVSGLVGTRPKTQKLRVICSYWALGHALTLLAVRTGVLLLGLGIPYQIS
ncbi:MAG: hypothetical protein VYC17_05755 [Nitrospinota bacterium]|nr:hypothetical protein [Nitrospinota bacterium]